MSILYQTLAYTSSKILLFSMYSQGSMTIRQLQRFSASKVHAESPCLRKGKLPNFVLAMSSYLLVDLGLNHQGSANACFLLMLILESTWSRLAHLPPKTMKNTRKQHLLDCAR